MLAIRGEKAAAKCRDERTAAEPDDAARDQEGFERQRSDNAAARRSARPSAGPAPTAASPGQRQCAALMTNLKATRRVHAARSAQPPGPPTFRIALCPRFSRKPVPTFRIALEIIEADTKQLLHLVHLVLGGEDDDTVIGLNNGVASGTTVWPRADAADAHPIGQSRDP